MSVVPTETKGLACTSEAADADKAAVLNTRVSPTGLFSPVVNGFADHFTTAQKSLKAMSNFPSKLSSSAAASSCQKSMPTQQPAKPAPLTAQPKLEPEPRQHSLQALPLP
ncbi:unnamed protein product [Leuciscus chuanchicus]